MALKRTLTKEEFEKLDAADRKYYVEEGDKYRLDAEPDDASDLKTTLQRERKSLREARARITELEKSFEGIDLDEYVALKERAAEFDRVLSKKKGAKGDDDDTLEAAVDKIKKQLGEKHATEIKKRDDELTALRSRVQRTVVEGVAMSAIAKRTKSLKLVLPHVLPLLKPVEQGDKFDVRVVGSDGEERMSPKAGRDAPMDVEELLDEMASSDEFAPLFPGVGASGGGAAAASNGGTGTGAVRKKSDLARPEDRARYIGAHGQEAFLRLPD